MFIWAPRSLAMIIPKTLKCDIPACTQPQTARLILLKPIKARALRYPRLYFNIGATPLNPTPEPQIPNPTSSTAGSEVAVVVDVSEVRDWPSNLRKWAFQWGNGAMRFDIENA